MLSCFSDEKGAIDINTITVSIDDKTRHRLEMLAKSTSRTKSYLITHAIKDYLEVNELQVQEITKGIKEADAGHLINHEDVLKKAIDSFGAWEEREESSVDIVNEIRSGKGRAYY